jgi:hypothetical protein
LQRQFWINHRFHDSTPFDAYPDPIREPVSDGYIHLSR